MLSILYGISSALTWGAGDFAGGLASRKVGAYRAVFYADSIGLVALIITVIAVGESRPAWSNLLIAALAGALGTAGLLLLYYSLMQGQMSIAAPVSALIAAALPVAVGALTEGLPTLSQVGGFALALAAVWLVSQTDAPKGLHLEHLSDLRLPLLAGVGFGAYFVLMHYATDGISATYWPMIASRTAGTVMILGIVFGRRESISVPRTAWTVLIFNGLLDVSGNFFYILALKTGRLDIAAVLSSLYPGATVILAWLILKERISRSQQVGILLVLLAIILLTI